MSGQAEQDLSNLYSVSEYACVFRKALPVFHRNLILLVISDIFAQGIHGLSQKSGPEWIRKLGSEKRYWISKKCTKIMFKVTFGWWESKNMHCSESHFCKNLGDFTFSL